MFTISSDAIAGTINIYDNFDATTYPTFTSKGDEYVLSFIELNNVKYFKTFTFKTSGENDYRYLTAQYRVSKDAITWTQWLSLNPQINNFPPFDPKYEMYIDVKWIRSGDSNTGTIKVLSYNIGGSITRNVTQNLTSGSVTGAGTQDNCTYDSEPTPNYSPSGAPVATSTPSKIVIAITGPQGAAGAIGADGADGAAGPQGVSGPVGSVGPQGGVGPTGPAISALANSTGIFYQDSPGLSIVDDDHFAVAPLEGWIVYNNGFTSSFATVSYAGGTLTASYITQSVSSYILIGSQSQIMQLTSMPTPQQRRESIYLGKVCHPLEALFTTFPEPDTITAVSSQLRDVMTPIRLINGGIYAYPNGNNLNLNVSAGQLWGMDIGYFNNDSYSPNAVSVTASYATTFQYRVYNASTYSITDTITPGVYDAGGTISVVPGTGSVATNQRIFMLQDGSVAIQYGQTYYSSLSVAISSVPSEDFILCQALQRSAMLIGVLSIRKDATDLSTTAQARFLPVSKFGEVYGAASGVSTGTLQTAYDNSTTEAVIQTNNTFGEVVIRRGTSSDDDYILVGQDGSSSFKFGLKGDGSVYVENLTINGLSASGTPMMVYVDDNGLIGATAINDNTIEAGTMGYFPYYSSTGLTLSSSEVLYRTPSGNLTIGGTADDGYLVDINGGIRLLGTASPSIATKGGRLTINEATVGPTNDTGFVTQFSGGTYGRTTFVITHTNVNSAYFGLNGTQSFVIGSEVLTPIVYKQRMSYTQSNIIDSGVERMRIHSNGFIGINNNNPIYQLDVIGNLGVSGSLYLKGTTQEFATYSLFYDPISGLVTYASASSAQGFINYGTAGYIPFYNSDGISLSPAGILYYDSISGYLSIGTTSNPGYILNIAGDININGTRFGTNDGLNTISIGNNILGSASFKSEHIAIGTNVMSRMVSGEGNIGIGYEALQSNSGYFVSNSIAIGRRALQNSVGSYNIAFGINAGVTLEKGNNNILIGANAGYYLGSASNNVYLGGFTGSGFTYSSNNIFISDGEGNLRFRIAPTGNFLLNKTTDNSYKFDVEGSAIVRGTFSILGTPELFATYSLFYDPISGLVSYASASSAQGFVNYGTAGFIPFYNSNGISLSPANTLYYSNEILNIGTTVSLKTLTITSLTGSNSDDVLYVDEYGNIGLTSNSSGSNVNPGTAGYLAYYPENGATLSSAGILYWSQTNSSLGIGKTPSNYNLDVNGNARISSYIYSPEVHTSRVYVNGASVSLQYIEGEGTSTGVFTFNNGGGGGWQYRWVQNDDQVMTLTTNNNLLIGLTADSSYRLNVNGSALISSTLSIPNIRAFTSSNVIYWNSDGELTYGPILDPSNKVTKGGDTDNQDLVIGTNDDNDLVIIANGTQSARFLPEGKIILGSGTNSNYGLNVDDSVRLENLVYLTGLGLSAAGSTYSIIIDPTTGQLSYTAFSGFQGPDGPQGPQGITGTYSGYFLQRISGSFSGGSMSGTPLYYDVTFPSEIDSPYVVNLDSDVNRAFTIENKTASGFRINSNSITPFSEYVYWEAEDTTSGEIGISIGFQGPQGDVYSGGTLSVTGLLEIQSVSESLESSVKATASHVIYNFSDGSIWYHATASTDYTADFINVPTDNNKALTTTIIIEQGSTPYIIDNVKIDGVTQSIKWALGATPSGNANKTDVIGFTFLRISSSWACVMGQLNYFDYL